MPVTPLQRKRVLEAVKAKSDSATLSVRYPLGRHFTLPYQATTLMVTQWAEYAIGNGDFVLGLGGECPTELAEWRDVMDMVHLYLVETSNNATHDSVVDIILWRRPTKGS
jgi:hypothetical protein